MKTPCLWTSSGRRDLSDLRDVVASVEVARRRVFVLPIGAIVSLLDSLGRELLLDDTLSRRPGLAYLATWLRRENLERLISMDLGSSEVLDGFASKGKRDMTAAPRGVVCHWIAGNVPTLGLFSLFQSILCKNANVLKVPYESAELVLEVVKKLSVVRVSHSGAEVSGAVLADAIALLSFPSENLEFGRTLSLAADARVVWGGAEAVKAIRGLPTKEICETLIFGPRYSFGAIDQGSVTGSSIDDLASKVAKDIVVFEQLACSSPHVVFIEKGSASLETFGEALNRAFQKEFKSKTSPVHDTSTCAAILNVRAQHLLSPESTMYGPEDLSWTILIDGETRLEEPICGHTIFLKSVTSLDEIVGLVTPKVQCVSLAVTDENRRRHLSRELAYRGVDRCVSLGLMHDYDFPWDGILPLGRLVRWVSLK